MLETPTAWDSVSCGCGSLVVSGIPWRPRITWWGRPGTGWSDVTEDEDGPGEQSDTERPRRLRPFGYRPTVS